MWEKLKEHEGEVFHTVSGLPFTYEFIKDNAFVLYRDGKRINRIVYKSQFDKAIAMNPEKMTDISYKIIAGAYIYALMQDDRIN